METAPGEAVYRLRAPFCQTESRLYNVYPLQHLPMTFTPTPGLAKCHPAPLVSTEPWVSCLLYP